MVSEREGDGRRSYLMAADHVPCFLSSSIFRMISFLGDLSFTDAIEGHMLKESVVFGTEDSNPARLRMVENQSVMYISLDNRNYMMEQTLRNIINLLLV